jgi:hypothetical protein
VLLESLHAPDGGPDRVRGVVTVLEHHPSVLERRYQYDTDPRCAPARETPDAIVQQHHGRR